MASGRVALTAALRMLGHGSLIVRTMRDGRYPAAGVLGAVSLASDIVTTLSLRDPERRLGWSQPVIDAIDTALWCRWGPPGMQTAMQALFATSAPTAVSAAYRVCAGTDAVPIYDPEEVWPPADASDAGRKLLFAAAPVALPAVAARVAQHGQHRSTADKVALLAPGMSAAVLAVLGARHRAHLQHETRLRWWIRTRAQVERERIAMRANLVTSSTVGHDFKKTLFALGLFGSDQAMAAARQQAARPADVIEESPGTTLKRVVPTIEVRPLDSQRLWIADGDIERIRRFVNTTQLTTQAPDGSDQSLTVDTRDPFATSLTYLGSTLRLANDPPPLLARLYPTAPALLIAAFWKASAILPAWRGLPPPIALGGAAIDIALAAQLWRHAPDDDQLRQTVTVATLNTAIGLALSATRLCPDTTETGAPALAGTSYLLGSALLISSHWNRLSPAQRLILPSSFAFWIATGRIRHRVPALHFVAESLIVLTPAVAGWKVTQRLDGEASLVERSLQAEFSQACDQAQELARADEMHEYRHQLDIARDAIVEVAEALDEVTRSQIEIECAELEAWIASA